MSCWTNGDPSIGEEEAEVSNPARLNQLEENLVLPLPARNDSLEEDPPLVTEPPTRNKQPLREHGSIYKPPIVIAVEDVEAETTYAIVNIEELEENYLPAM